MWEIGLCDSAFGGWFWIIPLAFMALCFVMMFVGHKRGLRMGCMGMCHKDHDKTESRFDESAADTARRRYAASEIGRQESQRVVSELGKE